jgi:hypothetical protein
VPEGREAVGRLRVNSGEKVVSGQWERQLSISILVLRSSTSEVGFDFDFDFDFDFELRTKNFPRPEDELFRFLIFILRT